MIRSAAFVAGASLFLMSGCAGAPVLPPPQPVPVVATEPAPMPIAVPPSYPPPPSATIRRKHKLRHYRKHRFIVHKYEPAIRHHRVIRTRSSAQ